MKRIHVNAARVDAGLTQGELAEKMGVSRQTVINWEANKARISTAHLYLLCAITGFSPNDILLPMESTESRQSLAQIPNAVEDYRENLLQA